MPRKNKKAYNKYMADYMKEYRKMERDIIREARFKLGLSTKVRKKTKRNLKKMKFNLKKLKAILQKAQYDEEGIIMEAIEHLEDFEKELNSSAFKEHARLSSGEMLRREILGGNKQK